MPEPASDPRWKIVRSFARFTFDAPLSVYYSEAGSAALKGRIVDIGLGGLRGLLSEDVAVGQRLWLEFSLPRSPEPLRILCKVKHGFDRQYGFQFLNITPEQRDIIRETCRDLRNV
jgi:PilZ domain